MNSRKGLDEQNPGSANPMANYQITPEEMRVLDECNWESFMKRSLPIGSFLGLGTYMGVQRGFFRPNLRFGAGPKVTAAVIVGYFLGKISYQKECAEKLMALPNSRIGQLLRDVRAGKTNTPPLSMYGARQEDIYSDAGPGASLDIETDKPAFADDPPTNSDNISSDTSPGKKAMTYDELRRQNREKYSDSRQNPYKVQTPSQDIQRNNLLDETAPPPIIREPQPRASRPKINVYGDVLD